MAAGASEKNVNGPCMSMTANRKTARALWYAAPGRAELRDEVLDELQPGDVLVKARFSLVSRGTERLVFSGAVPESEWGRMRAPLQGGDFPFPVKYGYAAVGEVVDGPDEWRGKNVFSLHPHQDLFNVSAHWLAAVPDQVPARRAVLAANMETALNALWDGQVLPGQKIVVVGAGIVGLLVAYLCGRVPGARVMIADILPQRRPLAEALGVDFCHPAELADDADLVFHTSAHPAGLNAALGAAGHEATIVELSWYGAKRVEVGLGDAFHVRRLKLLSSQVGHVATPMRARWSHKMRLAKALNLLGDPALDVLLDEEVAFEAMPQAAPAIFASQASGLGALIVYSGQPSRI